MAFIPASPYINSLLLGTTLGSILLVAFFAWREFNTTAYLAALITFACIGSLMYFQAASFITRNHFLNAHYDSDLPVEITAVIKEHPERANDYVLLSVRMTSLTQYGNRQKAIGELYLFISLNENWEKRELPFRADDTIRTICLLKKPDNYQNPGTFDVVEYMHSQGIAGTANVKSPLLVEIIHRPNTWFSWSAVSRVKLYLQQYINREFYKFNNSEQKTALLDALLFGNRRRVDLKIVDIMERTGLMHILAISGFHVWILSFICYVIFRACGASEKVTCAGTAVVIVLYWFMAGGKPSTSRACIVAVVYLLGKFLQKKSYALNNISFAAFIILVYDPKQLVDIGFQMTFSAAVTIVCLTGPLINLFHRLKWFGSLLSVSIAAQLGILPLTAYYMGKVSLHAPLTAVVVIPLVALILFPTFVLLLFGRFIPVVSDLLAGFVSLVIGVLFEIVRFFDISLPLQITVPKPPLWLVVVYYFSLLGLIAILNSDKVKQSVYRMHFSLAKSSVTVACIVLILVNPFIQPQTGNYVLHAIDVGQGDSFLLETPDGSAILVDGGGDGQGNIDIADRVVIPYITHHGHRSIDLVICSHPDTDHIGGLISLIYNFPVGEIWVGVRPHQDDDLTELLRRARAKGIPVRKVKRGDILKLRGVTFEVYNPPPGLLKGLRDKDTNDLSVVVRAGFGTGSILFAGDCQQISQQNMAAKYGRALSSNVLKFPHHGSSNAVVPEFLDAVNPDLALISVGRNNPHKMPKKEALQALAERTVRVLRTDADGAISLTFKPRSVYMRTHLSGISSVMAIDTRWKQQLPPNRVP